MSEWYRDEFTSLLSERDDERLKAAFSHTLRSNLRAISFFGPEFCEGVIAYVPSDRTVALGEEGRRGRRLRPMIFAVIALAVIIGGAAAQRFISTAQTNARGPVVLATPEPALSVASAAPRVAVLPPQAKQTVATPTVAPPSAAPTIAATPAAPTAAKPAPAAIQAAPPTTQPEPVAPLINRIAHRRVGRTPPPGRGVKTIIAQQTIRPTPEPTPMDLSDMPRSYSDATPLPGEAPPPAPMAQPQSVPAPIPTEAPSRGSWFHRTVMHLDPLKPHTSGWIYNSVKHLDPFKPHPQPTATATGGPQQP